MSALGAVGIVGPRIDPSRSRPYLWVVMSALGVVLAATAWAGAVTQFEFGLILEFGMLAVALPLMIEGTLAVHLLAATLHHSRGESTARAFTISILFVGISVTINVLHVLIDMAPTMFDRQLLVVVASASLKGLMSVALMLNIHTVIALVIRKPTLGREELRAQLDAEEEAERQALILEVQRQEWERQEQERVEREAEEQAQRRALEAEALERAEREWREIVASPESSETGTPEREIFVQRIGDEFARTGNKSAVARNLQVDYHRVIAALNAYENGEHND